MARVLVVGAGLSGAVYARELAERGHDIHVIDMRDHIGGNCYDMVDGTGIRRHVYGPHLFHTKSQRVVDWLSQFTDWTPYDHRVQARLPDGRLVPLPINRQTINAVFGTNLRTEDQVRGHLAKVSCAAETVCSAEDHLFSVIGEELTNLFFRPYTAKMWDRDLSELDALIVRRLPLRLDDEDRYFPNDHFQALPKDGYTAMFEQILNHPKISVSLETSFSHDMLIRHDLCLNSMPIDVFFDFELGELPYRSIRFETQALSRDTAPDVAVVNYTDAGPRTRETWWHRLPGHERGIGETVLRTTETPCDYRDNSHERYYPVKTADGRYQQLYQDYAAKAAKLTHVHFIGRCGTYQYLNMDQVVNQSLLGVQKLWATSDPAPASPDI